MNSVNLTAYHKDRRFPIVLPVGSVQVEYVNHSPDKLDFIWFPFLITGNSNILSRKIFKNRWKTLWGKNWIAVFPMLKKKGSLK